MHTISKAAIVSLLLILGVSLGFGWGTVTHVYFANHLGVRFGTLNQNEIYGATLNDLFGYDFTVPGFTADYALHTSKDLLWTLYASASTAPGKAVFYGMITHNNINDPALAGLRGADYYAHGIYPLPGGAPDPNGWVIHQGLILVQNPKISNYISALVPGYEDIFLPLVGHILTETAVDILVRDCVDPLVGARLFLAARNRSDEAPQVLAAVLDGGQLYPAAGVLAAEATWREQMKQMGELFLLPDNQLIAAISQQTAAVAEEFIAQGLGAGSVTVDPNKIAEFIGLAIAQVRPIYRAELEKTLCQLEKNEQNWPPLTGPIFAFWKDGASEQSLTELAGASETPSNFTLAQNYPNPFNPTTTIAYEVPAESHVILKIYNSIGQEVATLVDARVPAGRYVATWDARTLASGTYICRLQRDEGTVLIRKMMLLK